MQNIKKGIPASGGISIAKVYKLIENEIKFQDVEINDFEQEIKSLEAAIVKAATDLESLAKIAVEKLGAEKAAIFDAHKQMLNDPVMLKEIKEKIQSEKIEAAKAVSVITEKYQNTFLAMDNEYFKERAADIKDVSIRLIKHILNIPVVDLATINEDVIIVSHDLTPSETAQLNPNFVKGFACNIGGKTSHSAIMARSLEIPAVLGLKDILEFVKQDEIIAINGLTGEVIINPDPETIKLWKEKSAAYEKEVSLLEEFKHKETFSKDNKQFYIEANIGSSKDVVGAINNGAEGIGLFRSEFLYMDNSNFPSEEEQFQAYKEVLEQMDNKMVVIRTLDIGGDKTLSYFKFPEELNPFLGYRAIRLCLDKVDVFRVQIRALLRASSFGKLAIMFPMIATIDEFNSAKAIVEEEKIKLKKENISFSDKIEIGMMMEVPAAAVIADKFAKYADFFSIGTNDLIQYNMAADRMSEYVSYLYQPYNPSILRMVKMIIDGAHKHGKWVGMCGEMAGDEQAIPILLGLELDYFSMSATSIPKARKIISQLDFEEMKKLAQKAIDLETTSEVIQLVNEKIK